MTFIDRTSPRKESTAGSASSHHHGRFRERSRNPILRCARRGARGAVPRIRGASRINSVKHPPANGRRRQRRRRGRGKRGARLLAMSAPPELATFSAGVASLVMPAQQLLAVVVALRRAHDGVQMLAARSIAAAGAPWGADDRTRSAPPGCGRDSQRRFVRADDPGEPGLLEMALDLVQSDFGMPSSMVPI